MLLSIILINVYLTPCQEAIARAFIAKDFTTPTAEESEGNVASDPRATLEEVLSTVAESS